MLTSSRENLDNNFVEEFEQAIFILLDGTELGQKDVWACVRHDSGRREEERSMR